MTLRQKYTYLPGDLVVFKKYTTISSYDEGMVVSITVKKSDSTTYVVSSSGSHHVVHKHELTMIKPRSDRFMWRLLNGLGLYQEKIFVE